MIDLRKVLLKKTFKFYRNINRNIAVFYMNLMFHNFDDDLILVLIKTYNNILKKYEKKKLNFCDEYFIIFNYIIFSYFNFFFSELDLHNSILFDIFYDFNIKCLKNVKIKRKKKFSVSLYYNDKLGLENENHIKYDRNSFKKNTNNLREKQQYLRFTNEDKHINSILKKNSYYENYPFHNNTYLKYNNHYESNIYNDRNNSQYREYKDFNKNLIDHIEPINYINRERELFFLEEKLLERNDMFCIQEDINIKKKNLIKELKNLYAHVYYWKYLTELHIKCNRRIGTDEKNIYIDIYKNIYNLFKRMNEKHYENLKMLNKKREELSITHNNEMENIINENKINKKNKDYQQKINNMVYKHIAEKKALNRHIEHELNIMQQVNLQEYKQNIFYIFNIIDNNENILSLPPLPIEEKEKEKKLNKNFPNEVGNTKNILDEKNYKYIMNSFNFFYLYKLIKSRMNLYSYLYFHIKNSLYDVLNISVIFSLGEIFNIFERGDKNNIEFKKKFLNTLNSTYNIHYVYNYKNKICEKEISSVNMKDNKKNLNERNYSKGKLNILNDDKKKNWNLKKKDTQVITSQEEKNDDTYSKYQDSKYFDEKGNFKYRNLKEEKNFFNISYCSTYKFLKENSIRFLKNKTSNREHTNINTNKLCIKDKKLNALILYINEDFNFHNENVYKNLFNISITKTDFIFPNLKEQLNIFNDFKINNSYNYSSNMKSKNVIENSDEKNISSVNKKGSYFSFGNIIITRHTNLKIAMNEISNKEKNEMNMNKKKEKQNNINNAEFNSKNENNVNLSENNNISQISISQMLRKNSDIITEKNVFNSNTNYKNKCTFYKKFLKNNKKKNIHIDVIFHVIIPKNINKKSFKIILFSLFKILDICKLHNICSLNFSLPYVHNIVHKSKRPAIYSFIYSFIFSILEYVKSSESSSNNIKIFHFIFPYLKFYENKNYTKKEYYVEKASNSLISYNYFNTNNLHIEKNNHHNITEYKMDKKKKSYKKISNVTAFIDKIIVSLKERYILIENI
ncbi:conserved Plasmodium protein, unknown function [Plasmodium gallinaceum]|uniref:Uncharacterized protein n=1 Tax=Plasmodium gallinaceum TaxID=5849 RepID=A0A1J1GMF1_PLAGA|nr:conserved Plasmodium protein, unknown function [Plasmodium gallinaceum]CRG93577.1 conserved Plasmodium protein, unknown function [Plasmodium gallinaceum]